MTAAEPGAGATTSSIVVGVDGSPGSRQALAWAIGEARRRKAVVRAVLVWSDPYAAVGPSSLFGLGDEGKARLRRQLAATVRLARADEGSRGDGGEPAPRVVQKVTGGEPVEVLCAESRGADLLVVGTRGLGGLKHLLLGSVSERCAQLSPTPVVIVPPPGDGAG